MDAHRAIERWRGLYRGGYAAHRGDAYTRGTLERLLARLDQPIDLLDVGCGYCEHLDVYQAHCDAVVVTDAVDLSARFRALDAVTFHQTSVLDLRRTVDRTFDVVVASKLLHNVPRALHRRAIDEVAGSVRTGGWLLLSVASRDDPARTASDRPLPGGGPGEYLSGGRRGREAYRYYFDDQQLVALTETGFEAKLLSRFRVTSGLDGHGDRPYWMLLGRRRPAPSVQGCPP